jgi:4-hydroxy-tetrahydrodipicolinate reductase
MLSIALVGYGRMGKAIEQEAQYRNHQVSFRIDKEDQAQIEQVNPENTDVIIEFTHPDSFESNLQRLLPLGIPIVSGTTGWHGRLEEILTRVEDEQGKFLYSSNFSIGVNILFRLNEMLARLMNPYPEYDCFIEERHHRHKADGPSGTAISLAQQVLQGLDRKSRLSDESLRQRAPEPEELSVGFVRSGEIFGQHRVAYTSEIDSLQITHQAHNRRGFAQGAVIGAEWLVKQPEGVYDFQAFFK